MSAYATDLKQLADRYGIKLLKEALPDGISGMIQKEQDDITIRYNSAEPHLRQRFTIAHELGHFLAGHIDKNPVFRDSNQSYSQHNYDIKEVEANKIAAKLLMPEEKLKYLIYEKNITSISELAKHFDVSQLAMQYRLKNLGWIS